MLHGLTHFTWKGDILALLLMTQITIAAVTIYLHRNQTHRALTLHPVLSHVFRFWLWLTTGMVTKEWVSIHRKHHAYSDKSGDPHSPVVFGLKKVLLEGTELYRQASRDRDMIERYGHGTPNDWIERHLYSKYSAKGVVLLLILDVLLFGVPGLSMWAVQMLWIPFWAAGVVNGVGHAWGYRNFECLDAARNIFPWGFWIGGEELHNNHHTFASSAKFSLRWWEFDLGWLYIRCFQALGLAKVKKLPPQLVRKSLKSQIDLETVTAVVGHRFQVLRYYYQEVIKPMVRELKHEAHMSLQDKRLLTQAKRLLKRQENLLSAQSQETLNRLMSRFERLNLVYQYRQNLQNVWLKTASTQKELVEALQHWCKQAEESGIEVLQKFAHSIRSYQLLTPAI